MKFRDKIKNKVKNTKQQQSGKKEQLAQKIIESFDESLINVHFNGTQYKTQISQIKITAQWINKSLFIGKKDIAMNCKWFKKTENNIEQIQGIDSNIYQLNLEDIGATIQIQAIPFCDGVEYEGMPYMKTLGPIILDPETQTQSQDLYQAQKATFFISFKEISIQSLQGQDHHTINQGLIKIIANQKFELHGKRSLMSGNEILYYQPISEQFPELIMDRKNSQLVNIILNKNGDYISVQLTNNRIRDVFTLLIKKLKQRIIKSIQNTLNIEQKKNVPLKTEPLSPAKRAQSPGKSPKLSKLFELRKQQVTITNSQQSSFNESKSQEPQIKANLLTDQIRQENAMNEQFQQIKTEQQKNFYKENVEEEIRQKQLEQKQSNIQQKNQQNNNINSTPQPFPTTVIDELQPQIIVPLQPLDKFKGQQNVEKQDFQDIVEMNVSQQKEEENKQQIIVQTEEKEQKEEKVEKEELRDQKDKSKEQKEQKEENEGHERHEVVQDILKVNEQPIIQPIQTFEAIQLNEIPSVQSPSLPQAPLNVSQLSKQPQQHQDITEQIQKDSVEQGIRQESRPRPIAEEQKSIDQTQPFPQISLVSKSKQFQLVSLTSIHISDQNRNKNKLRYWQGQRSRIEMKKERKLNIMPVIEQKLIIEIKQLRAKSIAQKVYNITISKAVDLINVSEINPLNLQELVYYKNQQKLMKQQNKLLRNNLNKLQEENNLMVTRLRSFYPSESSLSNILSASLQSTPYQQLLKQLQQSKQEISDLHSRINLLMEQKQLLQQDSCKYKVQMQQLQSQKKYLVKKYESLSNQINNNKDLTLSSELSFSPIKQSPVKSSSMKQSFSKSFCQQPQQIVEIKFIKQQSTYNIQKQLKQLQDENITLKSLLNKDKKSITTSKTQLKLQLLQMKKLINRFTQQLTEKNLLIEHMKNINKELNFKYLNALNHN